jgi:hypothetical protein
MRLSLLDADGKLVDARYLTMGEVISPGSVISLPCHRVMVGDVHHRVSRQVHEPPLATTLDMRPGICLQKQIW